MATAFGLVIVTFSTLGPFEATELGVNDLATVGGIAINLTDAV